MENIMLKMRRTSLDISDRELLITKNCENPEKLLAWADDFYTDLASLQTFYGSIPDQVKDKWRRHL